MQDRIYRFAGFELHSGDGELRRNNSVVRLQDKPLRLLCALLDHPQRLVTREQLRERMWDSRTVVDFDQGINVAAKKVRDALGDSAESPRLIETVAKKGYRLLVPAILSPAEGHPRSITAPPAVAVTSTVSSALGDAAPRPSSARSRRWLYPAALGALLCVAGIAFFSLRPKPQRPVGIHSLAVLPLQDLSAGPVQDYFADGITEELITNLAQTLPLRVISRTSVMKFKHTNEPMARIARELGVEAVVEGAVARSGNRVSVTVQLIDAVEDRHLWAQEYVHSTDDVPAMEHELSQEIASQVGGTLSLQRAGPATSRVDSAVYELCLMGRYHWSRRTVADLGEAEEYFEQAIARDPNYAPAYAGLANVYALWPSYGTTAGLQSYVKAEAAVRRALELDDNLSGAHATLGFIRLSSLDSHWLQAGSELRRALQLNPSDADAHHWFAYYLFFASHRDEALSEIRLAQQLDPLSAITNSDAGHFLYAAGRYDEARVRLRRAMEIEPELGQPHETLALVEWETGHEADALREARLGLALDPNNPRTLGEAGYVLAVSGDTAAAERLLATVKDLNRRGLSSPTFLALIEIGLGRREQALEAMEELEKSNPGTPLTGLAQWHAFDALGTDPRYQKLLTQSVRAGPG